MKNLGRYDDELSVPRKNDVPAASTTAPKAPGTASVGVEDTFARGDHVHPSDDTKLDKNNPKATGSLTVTTAATSTILSSNDLTLTDPNGTGSNSVIDFLVRYDEQGDFSPYVNITRLIDPTYSTQPATKKYVDDANNVFIATYETTTYAEIKAAVDAGKAVFGIKDGYYGKTIYPLKSIDDDYAYFADLYYLTWGDGVSNVLTLVSGEIRVSGNTWTTIDRAKLVPQSCTVNGKALSSDITLGAMYSATLTSAGWTTSGAWKTQTVSVTGLKATYNAAPFVDVTLTGTDATGDAELAAAWLGISETLIADTAANSITVKFPATVDTPTVNIPITITTYD